MRRFLLLLSMLAAAAPALASPPTKKGWTRITAEDGITVYSKTVAGSDLVAFKGVTTIKAPLAKVLSVLMDNERRTEWVDRLKTSTVLEKVNEFEYVIYQHFELPFIISDRDYVYRGKAYRTADGKVTLDMKSEEHDASPESVGVRADLRTSRYVLIPKGKNQTTIEVEIHTDPCGMIPAWMVNALQKSWPLETLRGVRKQSHRKDVEGFPLPPLVVVAKKKEKEEEEEEEEGAQPKATASLAGSKKKD